MAGKVVLNTGCARSRRASLKALCGIAAAASSSGLLAKPAYPTKTIKIIAPVQPGGGVEPMPMSPEQFAQYMREDIAKWSRLARERGIEITE